MTLTQERISGWPQIRLNRGLVHGERKLKEGIKQEEHGVGVTASVVLRRAVTWVGKVSEVSGKQVLT